MVGSPGFQRAGEWVVVIPIKGFGRGKSRLSEPGPHRDDLALAFALDVVDAATGSAGVVEVLVVTGDPRVAERVTAGGAAVLAEPESTGDGLNAAVDAGIAAARERHPSARVAALTGDLPCLTAAVLADALEAAAGHPLAMVTDDAGVGTTMITARPGAVVAAEFGSGSRVRHEAAGHVVIPFPIHSGIRHDVDSPADLEVALRIGVGRHTAAALRADR